MNLKRLREIAQSDCSIEDKAARAVKHGSVSRSIKSELGDVSDVRGGGMFTGRRGKGVPKNDVSGARREFANASDEINIRISDGDEEYVIDLQSRKVRRPLVIRDGSVRPPTHSRPRRENRQPEAPSTPAPMSLAKARSAFRRARRRIDDLEAQLREAEKALADLISGAQRALDRAARLKESIGRSFVEALREKRDAPDFTVERDKILRDETEASARKALIPEAEERVKQARRALEDQRRLLNEASLDHDAALTAEKVRAAELSLEQLFEPLAALEAVTIVRAHLLGNSFSFDPRQHRPPLGAAEIVSAIVSGIPSSLSASLSRDAINARAHKVAAELLADLQPKDDGD
ncbi:MAG: hypothetical protein KJZ75_00445 [Hyphomonadaceae bacterium]|nr:hypothetical protein [Hyphomonadaceae bacterium]GIK49268.1 MAG: hypothetical protein BroJett013_19650 [Alphaproteobacteria bacterium]